jgi:hypothetical protein
VMRTTRSSVGMRGGWWFHLSPHIVGLENVFHSGGSGMRPSSILCFAFSSAGRRSLRRNMIEIGGIAAPWR